jgi:hypothetical protein
MPEKCKYPGKHIGQKKIERVILDLGAAINVISFFVYQELKLNELQKTGVVIQLAYYSYIHSLVKFDRVVETIQNKY